MIITGYQAIGKSTLVKNSPSGRIIDLESSMFWKTYETDNKSVQFRHDDWYIYYSQIAIDLSKQGFIVFVACHPAVREYIYNHKGEEKFCAIFPNLNMKDAWIEKLQSRYESSGLDKDFKALDHSKHYFESDINLLMNEVSDNWYDSEYIINKADYNLQKAIYTLRCCYSEK